MTYFVEKYLSCLGRSLKSVYICSVEFPFFYGLLCVRRKASSFWYFCPHDIVELLSFAFFNLTSLQKKVGMTRKSS